MRTSAAAAALAMVTVTRAAFGQADASLDAAAPVTEMVITGSVDSGAAIDAAAAVDGETAAPTAVDGGATTTTEDGGAVASASMRVALIDAAPIEVDPAAGTFVTTVLREQLAALGYQLTPTEVLYAAARRLNLPFPVSAEGLAQVARELGVSMAITAEVRARGGYYFATVRLRRDDEPTERNVSNVATQWTLGDRVRESLNIVLTGTHHAPSTVQITPTMPGYSPYMGGYGAYTPVAPRPAVRIHPQPFDVSGGLAVAFGPGRDAFFNFLVSGRFSWFPWDRFGFTASLSYVNLRGRLNRVSNILPTVGIETGVDLISSAGLYLPLRAEFGYLPFNGPVLRFSAGIAFRLSGNVRLQLDLLQPTIWFLPSDPAISLDVGANVVIGFGAAPPVPARRRRRRRTPATTTAPAEPTPAVQPPLPSTAAGAGAATDGPASDD